MAGVGWLSGTAAESLSAFGEHVFANLCGKKRRFYNCGKTGHLWLSKDLHTHTGTFPQTPFLMLRYVLWLCTGCTKALQKWALQKLNESRLYESSTKALRKLSESSPKALRKLSENSMKAGSTKALRKLSENSTKAGSTKALQNLTESSPKAIGKLSESSLKTLW